MGARRYYAAVVCGLGLLVCGVAAAHESSSAYLRIRETETGACEFYFKLPSSNPSALELSVSMPPDAIFEEALEERFVTDSFVRTWKASRPGGFAGQTITIEKQTTMNTSTLLRYEGADGAVEVAMLGSANPAYTIPAVPVWYESLIAYFNVGVYHILLGVDHLLFVLGLLLIVPSRWMLLKTVTSFTIAHSITLAAATLGFVHAPAGPLNAAIALSILFLGPEIVRSWRGESSFTLRHPWVVAFFFGLLHGVGFASGLAELGVPQGEIATALLMFNVGVEAGQIGFLVVVIGLLKSFEVLEMKFPRWAERAPGYAVGSLGAFWTVQRVVMLF